MIAHGIAALYAPIQDCDETFNYWEPLHYLVHGYGLQTWEYSPQYSIRSWAYILIHAIPVKIAKFLGKSKTFQFYLLRFVFAFVSAITGTRLYAIISKSLSPRIGAFYLAIVLFTPGFFYASTAFIPSSFAMYTTTLGLSAFLNTTHGPRTATGIFWFAVGAALGWPFAGALIVPIAVSQWLAALSSGAIARMFGQYLDGAIRSSLILLWQVGIDSYYYKKLVVVPWRIVAYNVLSGQGRGPDIFGTEPWSFYVKNLILNFNIWFILALLAVPLVAIKILLMRHLAAQTPISTTVVVCIPFYLWFAIFTAQPHKEERFMFPAYPFIAVNAAVAFDIVVALIGSTSPKTLVGKIPAKIKAAVVLATGLISLNIGLLRILGTITAYQAPLKVYHALEAQNLTASDTICFGKDWYRFPTSFHLPNSTHAKFVKSAYDGLLPGEFKESILGGPSNPGTWVIPPGMNDENKEDTSKYVSIATCDYMVDSHFPSLSPSTLEPVYAQTNDWKPLSCVPILDAGASNLLARVLWVPDLPFIPVRFRRVWGSHCLLRRRT